MKKRAATVQMFALGEDLSLFSGTPQRAIIAPFRPQDAAQQTRFPGFEVKMHDDPKKSKKNLRG